MYVRRAPVLAIPAILAAATLSAATRLVTTGGADSGNCTVTPCATLSYAISQAVNGDTIGVGPGAFSNGGALIVVNKSVMLQGAQAGFDARTRGAVPESLLIEPVQIAADGVILDGFTISCGLCDPSPCGGDCAGLITSSSFSGYSIINNIMTGNVVGVAFGSSGATTSTLRFNKIVDNDIGLFRLHYGIAGFNAVTNAIVDQNRLSGHDVAQIDFARLPPQSAATVTISNNSFPLGSTDGPAVLLIGNTGSVISGNSITGGALTVFGSIFLAGGDNNITVSGNSIIGTPRTAVVIWDWAFGLGVPFNGLVTVTGNTLLNNAGGVNAFNGNAVPPEVHFNRIVNNTADIAGGDFIRGENNWFGCNAGPAACATVTSTSFVPADLDPWLVMGSVALPNTITISQTSDVVAVFNRNSDGAFVAGFPDGTNVTFSASGGTMAPPASNTAGGFAASTFTPSALGWATVSATLDDQTVVANILVIAVADLGITASVSSPLFATLPMTKSLTVTNNGPHVATSVVVTDTLPAGLVLNAVTPSQGSCSGTTTITCNLGTVANGASATITLSITPNTAGPYSNAATVSTTSTDNNSANNSATLAFTVAPAGAIPALSVVMLALLGVLLGGIALVVMRTG